MTWPAILCRRSSACSFREILITIPRFIKLISHTNICTAHSFSLFFINGIKLYSLIFPPQILYRYKFPSPNTIFHYRCSEILTLIEKFRTYFYFNVRKFLFNSSIHSTNCNWIFLNAKIYNSSKLILKLSNLRKQSDPYRNKVNLVDAVNKKTVCYLTPKDYWFPLIYQTKDLLICVLMCKPHCHSLMNVFMLPLFI